MQPRTTPQSGHKHYKTSYAYNFVEFLRGNISSAKKISDDNQALRTSASMSVKLTRLESKLTNDRELSNLQGDVNRGITTLQAIPAKKNDAAAFVQQRDQLDEKIKSTKLVGTSLSTKFTELKTSVFDVMRNALDTVANMTSPEKQKEKSGSEDVKGPLKTGQKNIAELETKASKFQKECEKVKDDLLTLYRSVWKQVPTAEKTNLPAPTQAPGPRQST